MGKIKSFLNTSGLVKIKLILVCKKYDWQAQKRPDDESNNFKSDFQKIKKHDLLDHVFLFNFILK